MIKSLTQLRRNYTPLHLYYCSQQTLDWQLVVVCVCVYIARNDECDSDFHRNRFRGENGGSLFCFLCLLRVKRKISSKARINLEESTFVNVPCRDFKLSVSYILIELWKKGILLLNKNLSEERESPILPIRIC